MATANGKSSSSAGLVVGAFVVGGIVGFLVGQAVGGKGAAPGTGSGGPAFTSVSCNGPGSKCILVTSSAPGCVSAEMWAAAGDRISWQSPRGTALWIVFKDPTVFPHLHCFANLCQAELPTVDTSTNPTKTYEYDAIVYTRDMPTPKPTTPTPTPRPTYGRIIIKP